MARTEAARGAETPAAAHLRVIPAWKTCGTTSWESIAEYRREQSQVLIGDFNRITFQRSLRTSSGLGGGSLGGKARGLAFVRHLLHTSRIMGKFPGVRIGVPASMVLATDLFDEFVEKNKLLDVALHNTDERSWNGSSWQPPSPIAWN